MWFSRFFRHRQKSQREESPSGPSVNQGIFYLYLIIMLQVVFVLGLVGFIMFVGKILATPTWVFLAAFAAGVGGIVYIYRKARSQFNRLRESFRRVDLSDRNYEISIMGGVLTMRVEQNSNRLLEAPTKSSVLDTDAVETPVSR